MDSNGRTPLSYAAEGGRHIPSHWSKAIVSLLVNRGAIIETRDSTGRTPLSYAAEHGRMSIVRILVDRGAIIETRDSTGRTPLSYADEKGREAIHKLLLATSKVEVESELDTIDLHPVKLDSKLYALSLTPVAHIQVM
ncbi:hypothetical protein V2G26_014935 [Clonostachys chloroleuca]